jgi:hypothetical protein
LLQASDENMDYKLLIDSTGWIGSVLVIAAYISVSYEKFRLSARGYQLLNACGSVCLIVNTVYYHAYPSAMVNIIWLMIALLALWKTKARKV